MLGYHASIYRNQLIVIKTDIKQDQKYQQERPEENHQWCKVIAQIKL